MQTHFLSYIHCPVQLYFCHRLCFLSDVRSCHRRHFWRREHGLPQLCHYELIIKTMFIVYFLLTLLSLAFHALKNVWAMNCCSLRMGRLWIAMFSVELALGAMVAVLAIRFIPRRYGFPYPLQILPVIAANFSARIMQHAYWVTNSFRITGYTCKRDVFSWIHWSQLSLRLLKRYLFAT